MLQFLYMGEYTVKALPASTKNEGPSANETLDASSVGSPSAPQPKPKPPHLRRRAAQEALQHSQALPNPRVSPVLPAIAHVYVYAIAEYYALPSLQKLALTKFGDFGDGIDAQHFAEVSKAVYTHTTDSNDAMRKEVFAIAVRRMDELMACESFLTALAETADLQAFVATLLPAVWQQVHVQSNEARVQSDEAQSLKSVVEMQQKELAMTREALKTAQAGASKADELQKELKITRKSLQTAEADASKAREGAHQHEAELLAVRKGFKAEKQRSEQLDVEHNKSLIQLDNGKAKIREVQEQAHRHLADKLADTSTLRQSVQAEKTRSAQLDRQLGKYQDQLNDAKATVQPLQAEKARLFNDLVKAQESLRCEKAEKAENAGRVARAEKVVGDVIALMVKVEECRNCGDYNDWWLEWDNRTFDVDRGLMLKCGNCKCRHFN